MPDGGLVSVGRAASLLAVSPRTVHRLIDNGQVAAYRIGGQGHSVRISLAELQRAMRGWQTRTRNTGSTREE